MPKKYINLLGQKFGKLTPIKLLDNVDKIGRKIWLCKCDCGNEKEITQNALRSGNSITCGCKNTGKLKVNIIGKKFTRLLVLEMLPASRASNGKWKYYYLCLCDCGKIKKVDHHSLINNKVKSCGCYHSDMLKLRIGKNHPNWLETKTKRPARRNYKATKWSRFILNRDNNKCYKCGNDKKLTAHHLDSWTLNERERYNPLNGITLCEKCHVELHKSLGQMPAANQTLKYLGFPEDNEYFYGIEDIDFLNYDNCKLFTQNPELTKALNNPNKIELLQFLKELKEKLNIIIKSEEK